MKSIWLILLMLYGCAPAYAQLWPVSWLGQIGSSYIDTGMGFLDINSSVQMAGMADIGVVASGEYADAGLAQNPALLLDADQAIAGYVAWSPWLSALGLQNLGLYDWGGRYRLNQRHAMGYKGRLLNIPDIAPFNYMDDPVSYTQQQLRYAYALNAHFSLGMGMAYVGTSQDMNGQKRKVHTVAGDISIAYRRQHQTLAWQYGLSLSHLGPRGNYRTAAVRNFLPTNLKGGAMLSWNVAISEEKRTVVDLAYQFEKFLVPTAGSASDQSAFDGLWHSFADAPGGFSEEWSEVIHQVGIEVRRTKPQRSQLLAARTGLFYEHPDKGKRRFASFGLSAGLHRFRLDGAFLMPIEINHPLQNTFRVALVYVSK
jgi:hypothetical protein